MARQEAISAALHYLTFRARSRKEIIDYLRKKEYPESEIEDCIATLVEQNLINDMELAKLWVNEWTRQGKGSRRMLSDRLRKLGLERETINEALSDLEEDAEAANALAAARAIAYRYANDAPADQYRKLSAALARRGYAWDAIKTACREVIKELDEDYD